MHSCPDFLDVIPACFPLRDGLLLSVRFPNFTVGLGSVLGPLLDAIYTCSPGFGHDLHSREFQASVSSGSLSSALLGYPAANSAALSRQVRGVWNLTFPKHKFLFPSSPGPTTYTVPQVFAVTIHKWPPSLPGDLFHNLSILVDSIFPCTWLIGSTSKCSHNDVSQM